MTYRRLSQKKLLGMVLAFLTIGIVLGSVGANVAIQNQAMEYYNTEVLVLQVGSDANVQLAVDTFREYYPNDKGVRVVLIDTQKELFRWLIDIPYAGHVIFGHGTEKGLVLSNSILEWNILKRSINTYQNKLVPVMACYSGEVDKHYGGIPFVIDAEFSGIMSAYLLDGQLNSERLLSPEVLSTAFLKQKLLNHPLATAPFWAKWFWSEPAADLAANIDRIAGICVDAGLLDVAGVLFVYTTVIDSAHGMNPYILDCWVDIQTFNPILFMAYCVYGNEWGGQYQPAVQSAPLAGSLAASTLIRWRKESENMLLLAVQLLEAGIKTVQEIIDLMISGAAKLWSYLTTDQMQQYLLTMGTMLAIALIMYKTTAESTAGAFVTFGATLVLAIGCFSVALQITDWALDGTLHTKVATAVGGSGSSIENTFDDDADNDKLPKYIETHIGTSDTDSDSDDDGFDDGFEIKYDFDPLDPADPSPANWKDSELISGGVDTFNISRYGLENIDRVRIYKKHQKDESFSLVQTINVSTTNEFTSNNIVVCQHAPYDELDWTDVKVELEVQNNTAGTEFILVDTKYYYVYDSDTNATHPIDTDEDGLPDYYEYKIGTNATNDNTDHYPGGDSFTDDLEVLFYGTDPCSSDSDNDGIKDLQDLYYGFGQYPDGNKDYFDIDRDGLPNWMDYDSDNDGLNDSFEDTDKDGSYDSQYPYPTGDRSDWLDNDSDNDGLLDGHEVLVLGTDPRDSDSDDDGFNDGWEVRNSLNPLVKDVNDWAYVLADTFTENDLTLNGWVDDSTYGEMRAGGLATNSPYTNYEADEDFVVRVTNSSSGDWTLSSTGDPVVSQYSSGTQFNGFVTTWNLTNLRSSTSAEAIESATVTLDYLSNTDWDSDDKITVSLVNLYCNGSFLNDSSTNAHANSSLWKPPYRTIESISINPSSDSTIDITTLVDRWYLYSNDSMMSILIYPDLENTIQESTEEIFFNQGTNDPQITIKTGDAVLRASSYGDSGISTTDEDFESGAPLSNGWSNINAPSGTVFIQDSTRYISSSNSGHHDGGSDSVFRMDKWDAVGTHGECSLSGWYYNNHGNTYGQTRIYLVYVDSSNYIRLLMRSNYAELTKCVNGVSTNQQTTTQNWNQKWWQFDLTIDLSDTGNEFDGWVKTGASNYSLTGLSVSSSELSTIGNGYVALESRVGAYGDYWYDDLSLTVSTGTPDWHGPSIYHNFGCDIDSFELVGEPYIETSIAGKGQFNIYFYGSDNATGTELGNLTWIDHYTDDYDSDVEFYWNGASRWSYNSGAGYSGWYTAGYSSFTIIRNGTVITLLINGVQKYNASTAGSTDLRSISIEFLQFGSTPVCRKLGLRSISFRGHSDDYDSDGLNSSEEEAVDSSIWSADTDGDTLPDIWEADYHPTVDPTIDDDDADPDEDLYTNLEEYEGGTDPTVQNCAEGSFDFGAGKTRVEYFTSGGYVTYVRAYTYWDITVKGAVRIKVWYRIDPYDYTWLEWVCVYDTGYTGYTVGEHSKISALSVYYFAKYEVKWQMIAPNGTIIATHISDELTLPQPAATIYEGSSSVNVDGSNNAESTLQFIVLNNAGGQYWIKGEYRRRPYEGTWSSWTQFYWEYDNFAGDGSPHTIGPEDIYGYTQSDDFEVRWTIMVEIYDGYETLDSYTMFYEGGLPPATNVKSSSNIYSTLYYVMNFWVQSSGTYYIKVQYKYSGGSWQTQYWGSSYYAWGDRQKTGWIPQPAYSCTVYISWSIYESDGTTLIDSRQDDVYYDAGGGPQK
ncbi:MAG: hypothetical protein ACFE9L_02660 [Candidatus Hodarchaeota archaeon]